MMNGVPTCPCCGYEMKKGYENSWWFCFCDDEINTWSEEE